MAAAIRMKVGGDSGFASFLNPGRTWASVWYSYDVRLVFAGLSPCSLIEEYAKMACQERSRFCGVFTIILCALKI